MRGSREGDWGSGPPPPPIENHKNTVVFSNAVPGPLENQKATKPALNVGPSSAGQRNAI